MVIHESSARVKPHCLRIFSSGPVSDLLEPTYGYDRDTGCQHQQDSSHIIAWAPVWAGCPGVYSRLWIQVKSSSDQTGRYLDLETDNQEIKRTQMAPFEVFKYSEIFWIYPKRDSCNTSSQSLLKKPQNNNSKIQPSHQAKISTFRHSSRNQGNTQPQPKIGLNTNLIFYSRSIYDTTALNKVCLPRILYKD